MPHSNGDRDEDDDEDDGDHPKRRQPVSSHEVDFGVDHLLEAKSWARALAALGLKPDGTRLTQPSIPAFNSQATVPGDGGYGSQADDAMVMEAAVSAYMGDDEDSGRAAKKPRGHKSDYRPHILTGEEAVSL